MLRGMRLCGSVNFQTDLKVWYCNRAVECNSKWKFSYHIYVLMLLKVAFITTTSSSF